MLASARMVQVISVLPAILSRSFARAGCPISALGTYVVESGGVQKLAAMIPSELITETSSGTLMPRSRQVRSAPPAAIVSMSQKKAVGRSERDRK